MRGPTPSSPGAPVSARTWPLYAGGFLGPFAGGVVTPMLPELAVALRTDLATAAWSLTAYMIPFAAIMLVSGTFAERWGRARTIRAAYGAFVVASLLCAVAGDTALFLAARGLQGAANAFTSPLLVAAISDVVPAGRLGRALGRFGGWQASAQAFAPLIGGLAAAADYRWAFVVTAVAAAVLAAVPPPDAAGQPVGAAGQSQRWRALLNRRLVLACAAAFGIYLTTSGLTLLAALLAGDRFGLGPDGRGLVVAAFGVAGLATGARFGRLADRFGELRFGAGVLLVFAASTALTGLSPHVAALALGVAVGGATSTSGRAVTTTLAVTSTPANRAGATSFALAWQFLGSALAPVLLLAPYHRSAALGFVVCATGALGAAVLLAGALARRRRASR